MKVKILLAVLTVASLSASANIRVIGRGGGYGEMRALTALAGLRSYLLPCMVDPKLCGLSDEAHRVLLEMDKNGALNTAKGKLEFFTKGVTDSNSDDFVHYNVDQDRLSVSTRAIYDDFGEPKRFSEVAQTLFAFWMRRPGAYLVHRRYMEEFVKVFDHIELDVETLRLSAGLRLRHMQITSAGSKAVLLAMENAEKTVDITSFVNDGLPYKTERAKITEITGMSFVEEDNFIILNVRWTGGEGALFKGRIHLQMVDTKKEIGPDNLKMWLVREEEISGCEQKVTPAAPPEK